MGGFIDGYGPVDLLSRAKAGDECAFEALLVMYEPLIRGQVRRANRFRRMLDVEDLRQVAHMAFLRAVREYNLRPGMPARSFTEWARRGVATAMWHQTRLMPGTTPDRNTVSQCAHSVAVELHLEGPLSSAPSDEGDDVTLGETIAGPDDVEERAIGRVMAKDILRKLPEREAAVVVSIATGKAPTECADELGVSRQRVHQIIGRAARLASTVDEPPASACKNGHPRNSVNTIYASDGSRKCRECKRIIDARRDRRRLPEAA